MFYNEVLTPEESNMKETWDLEKGVLSLAVEKELLQLDALLERGVLDPATVEALMEQVADSGERLSEVAPSPEDPDSRQNSISDHDFPIGTRFGRYEELHFLGRGAMAEVYRAVDPPLNRYVALKFIRPDTNFRVKSVMSEARAQARIDHPNVCKVYEVGELEGKQFIAMQYLEGKTLSEIAADLTLEKMVVLFQQIAEGVHAAHVAGIIHRDLKPSNMLVEHTSEGEFIPYVLDFGLARELSASRATNTQFAVAGTPKYMSPEQARGDAKLLDRRSDVFSLGATFYEALTGTSPTQGETTADVLVHLLEKDPIPLRELNAKIPYDLQTIVMKCLEKEPEQRYDSSRALAEDLKRFLQAEPILARKATWKYRVSKKIRKHPVISSLLSIAVVLILITGIFALQTWIGVQVRQRLLQSFSNDLSKATEGAMRQTFMRPLHNAEPEKQLIRFAVQEYEPRLNDLGSLALGPMHSVFGRDYMAIQDWDLANKHLVKAWDEFQVHDAQTAYALTVTNAMLYRRKWKEAALFSRPLPTTPLVTAYLEQATGPDLAQSAYAEAWIAFLKNKPDLALKRSEQAFQKLPSLYEALALQGEIYEALAGELARQGDVAKAMSLYQKGEEQFERAMKLAPSDSTVYEGMCSLQREILIVGIGQNSTTARDSFQSGVQACENAIIANPNNATAIYQKALLFGLWADNQKKSGGDTTAFLQKAADSYETFCKMRGGEASALKNLGRIYMDMADEESRNGSDPSTHLVKARDALQRALTLNSMDSGTKQFLQRVQAEMDAR